jgi:hypothetical protein
MPCSTGARLVAVLLVAGAAAGCVDSIQILSLRLEKIEKDQVQLVALVDTDLEQPRYADCLAQFDYVIVDGSFSGRLVVGEDGQVRRLEQDTRENDRFLDEGLGHAFFVFKPMPGEKPKTDEGSIVPMGRPTSAPYPYLITFPRFRTGASSHEEPGQKDWVREYYLLERGKGYQLWGRIAGYRHLDSGFRSDVASLGFRTPD